MQGVKKYLLYDSKLDKAFPRVRHPALSLFYQSVKRKESIEKLQNWKIEKLGFSPFLHRGIND